MMRAKIAVTVDNFVFYKIKDTYKIALVERKNEPFKGHWALPGGFVDQDEDLPDAAKRELQEEFGSRQNSTNWYFWQPRQRS